MTSFGNGHWNSAWIQQRLLFTQTTKHCNVQSHSQHGWPRTMKIQYTARILQSSIPENNTSCSHYYKVLWPRMSPVDQLVYTVTQMATAVFYYPREWACFVCSWRLALTFFSHWWLRVQVSHNLFLLIVYCVPAGQETAAKWHRENPAHVGTSQELTHSPCSWWNTLTCAMVRQGNMIIYAQESPGNTAWRNSTTEKNIFK